jgi:RimJ/RimL family protein N-acetyltransferase
MSSYRFSIETDRLLLREMREEDALAFYQLNADPEVLKYTGDDSFEDVEQAREFLQNYPQISYLKDGYGRWTCVLKSSNEIIGWCGLRKQDTGETDLGYRFHQRFWGQGFATESSIKSLQIGFNELGLERIIARAADENLASIRVIQKMGMSFLKNEKLHGQASSIYELFKHDWDLYHRC